MIPHGATLLGAVVRLALALGLALPLGLERENRSRSAGLRTYPLLSVCVCGFLLLARSRAGGPAEHADALYGVLGGIGFVAAGAVVTGRARGQDMSTAVSLWVTGAIGAGVALGVPLVSAALAAMTALALWAPSLVPRRSRTS